MCRLYGMRATHPTRVECELVEAQNSLIRQSEEDARGLVNDDGWGLGLVRNGEIRCVREVGPASESASYRRDAARVSATTVLAHVRRGTVGAASGANTHPFRRDRAMFVHNGHIGAFEQVRPRLLAGMRPVDREALRGTTDSEHFFHLLTARRARRPTRPMVEILGETIRDVTRWVRAADPDAEVALNVVWTVNGEMVGSRLGRSLWYAERDEPCRCGVCERRHPVPDSIPAGELYRGAVVASEPISDEPWRKVPKQSVFGLDDELTFRFVPLNVPDARGAPGAG